MITKKQLKRANELEDLLYTLRGYLEESPHVEMVAGIAKRYQGPKPYVGKGEDSDNRKLYRDHRDIFDPMQEVFKGLVSAKIAKLEKEYNKIIEVK